MRKLSDQDKIDICRLYSEEEYSTVSLGKLYGVDRSSIKMVLRARGVVTRKNTHRSKNGSKQESKYNFNENFFNTLDSPEKAYFLGMMYSDGYNCVERNFARLKLQESDEEILIKINNLLESDRPIERNNPSGPNNQFSLSLTLSSRIFCEDLEKLGCMQAKTFVVKWPNFIEESLKPHFIRGLWDGDGYIGPAHAVYIGTEDLCMGMKREIDLITGGNCSVVFPSRPSLNGSIRRLVVNKSNGLLEFLHWIYQHSTIHLERKYQKYQNVVNFRNKHLLYNEDGSLLSAEQKKDRKNAHRRELYKLLN